MTLLECAVIEIAKILFVGTMCATTTVVATSNRIRSDLGSYSKHDTLSLLRK